MNQRQTADRGSLQSLLSAAAKGDSGAFRALYEATSPKLFGVVLRIVRNRPVAEEVLQETYVKIWQNVERFVPEAGEPMAWLTTIARNRAIDRIRSEKVEQARTTDDDTILERLAAPAAGDPAMARALRHCLDELDEDARNCVVLAYCSGYSREELGERFNRPVGTIKTLLFRSIRLLRACLERE
ncbi:MAG: sigma-70 family RNA polymerase sigma factor [Propylenella sp.]